MTRPFLPLCLLLLLFVLNGCGGVPKPEDFPDVVAPVTVKVHRDGSPLRGVTVILHSKEAAASFLVTGETEASGVATIVTSRNTYTKAGAPKGKYLVQLTEVFNVDMPTLSMDATPEQEAAWQKEYNEKADKVRSFPKALSRVASSPLEIDITSAPVAVEFDVTKY